MIVASLPTTCAATISVISGITGLTLPGMIELPGWSDGSEISPMPQRGPEASQRRSLAILVSDDGDRLERAARPRPRRPCAAMRLEVVARRHERMAGALRDAGDDRVGEARAGR